MQKDFSRQDLRNGSFRGDDLSGAVFHGSDLRGVDFSYANLRGADFSEARAGMRPSWAVGVAMLAFFASAAMGIAGGLAGRGLDTLARGADPGMSALALFLLAELVICLGVFAWRGLDARHFMVAAACLAALLALIAVLLGVGRITAAPAVLAFGVLLGVADGFANLARAVETPIRAAMLVVVSLAGVLAGGVQGGGWYVVACALAGLFAADRAVRDPSNLFGLSRLSSELACMGGTRFSHSDLTDARFDRAELRGTDFRGARLLGAHLENARMRHCSFDAR